MEAESHERSGLCTNTSEVSTQWEAGGAAPKTTVTGITPPKF